MTIEKSEYDPNIEIEAQSSQNSFSEALHKN
jgi:hypothetical protein